MAEWSDTRTILIVRALVVSRLVVELDGSVGGCLRELTRWEAAGEISRASQPAENGLF
jgi:hypothetical protein